MYPRFMDAWIEVIEGEREDTRRLIDSAHLPLTMQAALETDEAVERGDPAVADVHADGSAFLVAYRS